LGKGVGEPYGQKRDRIPEADRKLPALGGLIFTGYVSIDCSLRVEDLLETSEGHGEADVGDLGIVSY
jgi:hypothetical protein